MKAWHFTGTGKPLEWVELPAPKPADDQVLIDVTGCGLCHTDVGVLDDDGWLETLASLPIVMGHEVAGRITAVGKGVTDWQVGDRVGVCPTTPAGAPGFTYNGGFAEQMTVAAGALVAIPDEVSFALGATATDAGMTAYHAIMTTGGLQSGMKLGVIGLGGLGQIGVRAAVLKGADVYVAEINKDIWPMATELGAKQVSGSIMDFADKKLDLIVDLAGFGTTTAEAIEAIGPGGRVVQVGMGKLEATVSTKAMILKKITLVGSNGGTREDIAGLYELFASGELNPVTTEISLEDIPEGLEKLRRGEVTGRLVACPVT